MLTLQRDIFVQFNARSDASELPAEAGPLFQLSVEVLVASGIR